jgi:hypothetical protein
VKKTRRRGGFSDPAPAICRSARKFPRKFSSALSAIRPSRCIARLIYKSRRAFLRGAAATAVAISGSRILAVGSLDQVKAALGELRYRLDKTFADKVIDMANSASVRRAPTRWCGRPRR